MPTDDGPMKMTFDVPDEIRSAFLETIGEEIDARSGSESPSRLQRRPPSQPWRSTPTRTTTSLSAPHSTRTPFARDSRPRWGDGSRRTTGATSANTVRLAIRSPDWDISPDQCESL